MQPTSDSAVRSSRRLLVGALAWIFLAVPLAGVGCGGGTDADEASGREANRPAPVAGAEPLPPSPGVELPDGQGVGVVITDDSIEIGERLASGPTVFRFVNRSGAPVTIELTGQGLEDGVVDPIEPGGTAVLEIDLLPGEYDLSVPGGPSRELTAE